ncbi:MAG: hypothetical protein KME49_13540 [Brasilonema octagenarum HA4186-MV1]|jgi:hypothetical protein|nr:hypothetical protein [Brasilonema octagenarum HA4186-MV1]
MTAILHLTDCDRRGRLLAIEQGANYRKVTILAERDLTTWTLRGHIRDGYASRGGTLLAEFSFEPVEYKNVTVCNKTVARSIIKPFLTVADTQVLSTVWITKNMYKRTSYSEPLLGQNVFCYDIEAEAADGETLRLAQGFVEISLEVTADV